ncbi:MAG: hypothetical protein AAF434_10535 [Pseudomonadota bacterium]
MATLLVGCRIFCFAEYWGVSTFASHFAQIAGQLLSGTNLWNSDGYAEQLLSVYPLCFPREAAI